MKAANHSDHCQAKHGTTHKAHNTLIMQKTIDNAIKAKIRVFLEEKYTSVVIEDDGRYCDCFAKGEDPATCDHIAVFLDCDDELTVSANCWDQKNNVLLENAINSLITA